MTQTLTETQNGCPHHWIIETPGGPTSIGTCKLCGAKQEFRNSLSIAGWERETLSERMVRTAPVPAEEGESVEPEKEPPV